MQQYLGSAKFDPDQICTEEECPFPGHDAFEEKQAKKTRLRNQVRGPPGPSDLIWHLRGSPSLVILSIFCRCASLCASLLGNKIMEGNMEFEFKHISSSSCS